MTFDESFSSIEQTIIKHLRDNENQPVSSRMLHIAYPGITKQTFDVSLRQLTKKGALLRCDDIKGEDVTGRKIMVMYVLSSKYAPTKQAIANQIAKVEARKAATFSDEDRPKTSQHIKDEREKEAKAIAKDSSLTFQARRDKIRNLLDSVPEQTTSPVAASAAPTDYELKKLIVSVLTAIGTWADKDEVYKSIMLQGVNGLERSRIGLALYRLSDNAVLELKGEHSNSPEFRSHPLSETYFNQIYSPVATAKPQVSSAETKPSTPNGTKKVLVSDNYRMGYGDGFDDGFKKAVSLMAAGLIDWNSSVE